MAMQYLYRETKAFHNKHAVKVQKPEFNEGTFVVIWFDTEYGLRRICEFIGS